MKAPHDLDPDVHTVLEIVQHAAEILSRVPLAALRAHLESIRDDSTWYSKALSVCLAAQQLDAAQGILSAEEARVELPPAPVEVIRPPDIPDDWTVR